MSLIPSSEWGDGDNVNFGGPVAPPEPNEEGHYFKDKFEGDVCGWTARGDCEILTSGRTAYTGSEALLSMNRTATWNGAQKALSTRMFEPGKEYAFSACFQNLDGADDVEFKLTLQYDQNGETKYEGIAQSSTTKGSFVQLYNANYKIPEGASNMYLVAETTEETCNFYIDDVIGAVAGTKIDGPAGVTTTKILGDIDFDGRVTVADMVLMKSGILNGFSSSAAQKNADVNQSRKVDSSDAVSLKEYLLGIITEFPKAEIQIDTTKMDALFGSMKLAESLKKDDENNTLYTQRFGADPGFLVYKGRLYVYTTNDAFEYKNGVLQENSYNVQTLNCISSDDLVNWTDHGAIPVAGRNGHSGPAKWAGFSWAPDACWKTINGKDKFFLYFADSAGGIGVLSADSPTGPFVDPIGKALISRNMPNCNVDWLFDPGVFVDSDGKGYLYFGGGVPSGKQANPDTARCVQLGDDMTSIVGTPKNINPPYLFEDSSILKIGNTYYYSYCTNWSTGGNPYGFGNAEIAYMTSSNPLGPFTYQGIMFKNPASYKLDGGGNNHHSLVEFEGKYYLLYHSRVIERRMGVQKNYRSPHIDYANVSNGKISVTGTMKGVSQLKTLNPYNKVEAETMSHQAGINVSGVGNTVVTDIQAGDWIRVQGVNFSNGAATLKVRASSKNGGAIKVATSRTGSAVAYVEVPGGSMSEIEVPVFGDLNGKTDLYFIFGNDVEFDWWQFS
ncbi:MAG: carbohydrate-binding protein, partial [Ruminococcus sp.]|nr:carbohydrate-binding protein [Ruminococcus sp.]